MSYPATWVPADRRPSDLCRDAFQQAWLRAHVDRVASKEATTRHLRRCAQLHPFDSTERDPEGSKIEEILVFAVAALDDVDDCLVTGEYAGIEATVNELVDPESSEFWTAIYDSVIKRLLPELATER